MKPARNKMIILGQKGFTFAELIPTLAIAAVAISLAPLILVLMQRLSYSILVAQTKEQLVWKLYNASINKRALKETIDHNPTFAACFIHGSAGCSSGVTQTLTLYDFNAEVVAGPGQAANDGQPAIYNLHGNLCHNLTAPTTECPISVVANFEAQGYPNYVCLNAQCSDSQINPPPALGLPQELLLVHYIISFAPVPEMPPQHTISGGYVIDIKDSGF